MKRWYANLLMRWAFRVFRRYHGYLPESVTKEGIIWGEITRRPDYVPSCIRTLQDFDPNCSTCVRELEEDRASQEKIKRWLKGKRNELR